MTMYCVLYVVYSTRGVCAHPIFIPHPAQIIGINILLGMALKYFMAQNYGSNGNLRASRPSENNGSRMQHPRNEVSSNRLTMATDEDLFVETEDDGLSE